MWFSITKFELGYQLKSPAFWVSFIIFFLMGFGIIAAGATRASGDVHLNSPLVIVTLMSALTLFFMFVTTAFGANVILRDQETGFAPLLYATRITKGDYVTGRMLGAFLICALCFASVPLGMLIGTFMPWMDKDLLGPPHIEAYAYGYFAISLPSIFFMVAFFSGMATVTRSMMGSYFAAVVLFIAYMGASFAAGKSDTIRLIYAWVEPFGDAAISEVTRYWTADDNNSRLPAFTGIILGNRLIFLALGVALMAGTQALLKLETVSATSKARPKPRGKAPVVVERLPDPTFGPSAAVTTFLMRTRFEMGQVLTSPAYPILMVLGLVFTGIMLLAAQQIYGTDVYPVTRVMVSVISAGFFFFAYIVAVFYSGELIWRERDRKTHEIIDSTAIPGWAYVVPKALALVLVLLSTLVISMAADMAVQIFKGWYHFEFGKYVMWMLLPRTLDMALIGILAIFVQSLSPHKFAGWGVMLVWFVGCKIALPRMGFDYGLYNFGASPQILLSDMNGMGQFWIGWLWYKLYWSALAIAMLVISHLLWRRGVAPSLTGRLRLMGQRLKGPAGAILGVSLIAFAGLGGFIFYNTNILNKYYTKDQTEKNEAGYEKTFTPVQDLPLPSVSDVKLSVDLYPHQLKQTTHGVYTLTNTTGAPVTQLYLSSPDTLIYQALTIDGAHQKTDYPQYGVKLFVFDRPMAPGEQRTLRFTSTWAQKGFGNDGITTRIVDNGTFLHNADIGPSLGVGDVDQLTDKGARRKYHLPEVVRMKKLEDPVGDRRNYIGADWTTSDITVSTVADQTPVAPGYRVSDVTQDGRRTSRFVSTTPILNFFSIQSAHYVEKHVMHNGIDLGVYYDAQHPYNVDDMLHAMAFSLDYYQANFSPYQFKQARILEFPAYSTFAQSFANTIPYSEGIGFIADVRDPDKIDYTTYVTAHELGHQWWAHQIVGGDKEGAESLSETLAQYSALMVMEKLYGPDKIRRFLKYELDTYLLSRRADQVEEQPLYREQHEQYIYYNKGSLVMYLLKDRMGEDKVNAALRTLLHDHAFKGAPYPRSTDLINALRAQAGPQEQGLITDLFEKITLVDLRTTKATVAARKDGRFDVTMVVTAHKFHADGKGKETETPMNEPVDIGLFTAQPGEGKFNASNVVQMGKQMVHTGTQTFTFTVAKKPSFAGVDPYNTWIDRDTEDNTIKVK